MPDAVLVVPPAWFVKDDCTGSNGAPTRAASNAPRCPALSLGEPFHVVGTMHWYLVILPAVIGALVHQGTAGSLVGAPALDRTGRDGLVLPGRTQRVFGSAAELVDPASRESMVPAIVVPLKVMRGAALVEATDHGLDEDETLERTGAQAVHSGHAAVETDDPVGHGTGDDGVRIGVRRNDRSHAVRPTRRCRSVGPPARSAPARPDCSRPTATSAEIIVGIETGDRTGGLDVGGVARNDRRERHVRRRGTDQQRRDGPTDRPRTADRSNAEPSCRCRHLPWRGSAWCGKRHPGTRRCRRQPCR